MGYQLLIRICVLHCCAFLVGNYQTKYSVFLRWKAHPIKNQKFPRKITLVDVLVPLYLKEAFQFLKTFGLMFPFKQTGHLASK